MTLSNGPRLGPYEIIAPAGAGGMGEVYRARDTRLARDVAIKVLPEHLSDHPDLRARFEREARAVSSLNHPHICTLHDIGHEDGIDYLVMEYLEGQSLAARLETGGPLQGDELLGIATQIAEALDTAHRQGLVHRDLKPGNIMLTPSGAKVLDFGLAKMAASGPTAGDRTAILPLTSAPTVAGREAAGTPSPLTAAGTILGTFQYMAPEQIEGKEADVRSDIFAYGATLYEMATGQRPFQGETQASLIASILKDDPRSIASSRSRAPGGLDRLVRNCLAKNPADRRQTMRDVLLDLRALADADDAGHTPDAGHPSSTRAAVTSRSARGAWAVATLALAVAALTAVAWWTGRPAPLAPAAVIRSSVEAPDGMTFQFEGPNAGAVTVSPDGRFLTFSATSTDGIRRL
ncbi:MAG: serine/threonine-protein kinase [Acidobacteriota bacterium]